MASTTPYREPDDDLTQRSILRREFEDAQLALFRTDLARSSVHPKGLIAATSTGVLAAFATFLLGTGLSVLIFGVSWGLPMAPVFAVAAVFVGLVASVVVVMRRR